MTLALVTLADAQAYIGLSAAASDDRINRIAESAEDWIADKCGVSWTNGTKTDYLSSVGSGGGLLRLQNGPASAVTSVDDRDLSLTLDSDEYRLSADGLRLQRLTGTGGTYTTWEPGMERYTVVYTGGYDGDDAPESFSEAVLQLVRRWWDTVGGKRSESSEGLSVNWASLADSSIMEIIAPHIQASSGAILL